VRKRLQQRKPKDNDSLKSPRQETGAKRNTSSKALATYQQKVCDLELELSRLRSKIERSEFDHPTFALYEDLFQGAPVGYMVLDEMGIVHDSNRHLRMMLSLASSLHGPFIRFIPKENVVEYLEHVHRATATIAPVRTELRLLSTKGVKIDVEMISLPAATSKGAKHLKTIVVDSAQRTALKQALDRTQHDFQILIDTIQGIVWEADPETLEVTYISRSVENLLGHPHQAWCTADFWLQQVHGDDRDRVATVLSRASKKAADILYQKKIHQHELADSELLTSTRLEFRMLNSQREVVWLHSTLAFYQVGGRIRLFGVGVEITERRLAEEQLQIAHVQLEKRIEERTDELRETVSQLEAFSYSLSHDMRAPLRSVHGFCEMLRDSLREKLSPFEQNLFERVMISTNRLDRMIQEVLHYSNVSRAAVELHPVELEQLVDSTIGDYPSLQERRDNIAISRPLLPVVGNEAFLSQCFFNLLSNALKFVPPGHEPQVSVQTERIDGQVRVWVTDNGIGIKQEDQKRVFSIFQRFHKAPNLYEGTGLGLAIVAKAIERMGGSLGVESRVGIGSKFWFQLPAA
jgi:signal transduction histidine kinase